MKKSSEKKLEIIDIKKDNLNYPYSIKIPNKKKFNSKDILRINSQLITQFIKGNVDSAEAKTLSYLCSNYIQALNQTEIEDRIKTLEDRI